MESGLEEAPDGIHVWLVLRKAFRTMEIHAERSIAGLGRELGPWLGLCWSDYGVMEALLHKGPMAVKALREKVLLASGSMTAAVDRLERRGWVTRIDDPADRRSRIVRLTAEGQRTIEGLFPNHERDMEQAVAGLNLAERMELVGLLLRLGRSAEEREVTAEPREN